MNKVDREFFKTQGYWIGREIIPQELIQKAHREIHLAIVQQLELHKLPVSGNLGDLESLKTDLHSLYKNNLEAYLSTLRLCAKLVTTFEIYMHPNMLSAAKQLGIEFPIFQTQPVFHLLAESLRIKDGYFGVAPHQDWPALQSGLDTITTWVPLNPVKKNHFTLEILPGSHLWGMVDAVQAQHAHEVSPHVYEGKEFLAVEMKPGDALMFSTFLIHRSEINGNPTAFRSAFSMRYENASNPYYIAKGYPFAQKRVVDRELDPADIPDNREIVSTYQK